MTRDNLADAEYFSRLIEKEKGHLAEDRQDVTEYIRVRGARAAGISANIVKTQFRCASMAYSRGDSIENVREWVVGAIDDMKYLHELYEKFPSRMRAARGSFNSGFYPLAHAVLFFPGDAQVDRILFDADFFEFRDPIMLAMISFLKKEPINRDYDVSDLDYPDQFSDLWLAIAHQGEAAIPPLERYLTGWYDRNKKLGGNGAPGIGSHEKMIRYAGYWCWEAAAIAVMMDIDDTQFRDHEHYPKELADWARIQKAAL